MCTGVWRYHGVATGEIHTFLFADCRKKKKQNGENI